MQELESTLKQQTSPSMQDLEAQLHQQQLPADTPPSTDPSFGANVQLANPMGQSLSNVPEGTLPSQNSLSNEGVASWEKNGTKWNKVPTFVKTVQMIASGTADGSLLFSSNLLSQVPGLKGPVQEAHKYWTAKQKEYEDQGFSPTAFNIGKGAAALNQATVLLKNPQNLVADLASGAKAALPGVLGKAGQYGTQALGNTALLSGLSSQQYDPNKPDQLFNKEAALDTLTDPKMYGLSAAGTAFSNWTKNARALADAQAIDPNAMARNVMHNPSAEQMYRNPGSDATGGSALRKAKDLFFGITPALTEMGKQYRQTQNMGNVINGMVQDLSGQVPTPAVSAVDKFIQGMASSKPAQAATVNADKLTEWSSNIIQSTMKKMGRTEDKLWDQGFKTTPILSEINSTGNSSVQAVKDAVVNAKDLLTTNEFPGYKGISNSLDTILRDNPTLTVGAVKQLNTVLSGASLNAREISGGIGNILADKLKGIKDELMGHISSSISLEDLKAYNAASQFSAHKFDLFDNASQLKSAVTDVAASHKLVASLISEGGVLPPKQAVMGMLSPGGQDMIAATKIRQALESSDTAGRINLDSFLTKTGPNSQTGAILSPTAQKTLQGLQVYLKNIDESQKVGWWRQAAIGGTIAAGAGLSAYENKDNLVGAALPLVSYMALTTIANHSPLKSIFNALTKNLPKNTFNALSKAANNHLVRTGYVISNGVLTHKNDVRPSDIPPQQGIQ